MSVREIQPDDRHRPWFLHQLKEIADEQRSLEQRRSFGPFDQIVPRNSHGTSWFSDSRLATSLHVEEGKAS